MKEFNNIDLKDNIGKKIFLKGVRNTAKHGVIMLRDFEILGQNSKME
jgi:hypothetical protein